MISANNLMFVTLFWGSSFFTFYSLNKLQSTHSTHLSSLQFLFNKEVADTNFSPNWSKLSKNFPFLIKYAKASANISSESGDRSNYILAREFPQLLQPKMKWMSDLMAKPSNVATVLQQYKRQWFYNTIRQCCNTKQH